MEREYIVKGWHGATQRVVEAVILASSPRDARRKAEAQGLTLPVITPKEEQPPPPPPGGP